MPLLDDVKLSLRITTADFDSEVQGLIDAASADLILAGMAPEKAVETDPLYKRAVILYSKAHFGFDNPDTDRLVQTYLLLKQHLTLSADYTPVPIDTTVVV